MAVVKRCQSENPGYSVSSFAVRYLGPIWEKNLPKPRKVRLKDPQTFEHLELTAEFIQRFEMSRKFETSRKIDVTVQVVGDEEEPYHFSLGKKDLVKSVECCLARKRGKESYLELQHDGEVLSSDVVLGTLAKENTLIVTAHQLDEPPMDTNEGVSVSTDDSDDSSGIESDDCVGNLFGE